MRKWLLLIGFLTVFVLTVRGEGILTSSKKHFNYGAKIGFNAAFPVINDLVIEGVNAENITLEYKVGYTVSLFGRFNIKRFFIQPEISWTRSLGSINYFLPDEEDEYLLENTMSYRDQTIVLPMMIGYNLIKQGPYGLSLMAGSKFRYTYKSEYTNYSYGDYVEFGSKSNPFGVNIAAGLSISIGRLFLDFVYEFGLNRNESDFSTSQIDNTIFDINLNRRTNMLSFSLGCLF